MDEYGSVRRKIGYVTSQTALSICRGGNLILCHGIFNKLRQCHTTVENSRKLPYIKSKLYHNIFHVPTD